MSSHGGTTKSQQELDELFPAPSLPPSRLSPQRLPGANPASVGALQEVLKDNHLRHHVYWNHTRHHNHITHRALAIYALGGSAPIIRDYYQRDGEMQRPASESPEPITEENFTEHLGDENFYQGYVTFFTQKISENGVRNTLEEFIFSKKYNFQTEREANAQPEMLTRFLSGLLHSLIHVGYGLEFGLKGMVVEGLALAAVHKVRVGRGVTISPSLFTPHSSESDLTEYVASRTCSLALDPIAALTNIPLVSKTGATHAFDIVAHILKDKQLESETSTDFVNRFIELFNEYSPMIWEYAEKWTIDLDQPDGIERKMEELVWLSALLYGAGGFTSNGFVSEFFLMHLVTSSLFLPSLIAYLEPRSRVLLLRGYLHTVLTWWVMRGRPALNIKSLMMTASVESMIVTSPVAKTPCTTETTTIPNPFLPILQSAITHPDNHLVKIQRTFAHFDTLYGTRPAGYFKGTELEDAELLDGSLFLRAALLTADYVGWVREGQESRQFDFGYYA